MLAVKVPTIINFGEVLNLDAIKYLKGKNREVFDFMSLFTSIDAKDFTKKVEHYRNLSQMRDSLLRKY